MPDSPIYPTIVRITDKIGTSYFQGSGVLISPDEVLTASHMVWSTGIGVATDVMVSPGSNAGAAPYGTIAGTVAHYNPINDSSDLIPLSNIPSDFALIHLSAPVNVGTMSLGRDYASGTVTVSGYPTSLQTDQSQFVYTGSYNLLNGTSLGQGSSGGPVWTINASGVAEVEGLVSASGILGTGYFTKITASVRAQLETWLAQDDNTPTIALYSDTVTGKNGTASLAAAGAGGPVSLDWTYLWSSNDGVSLASATPNVFLHGGAGDDAISVSSGQNVLDGGTGSNFLVGGTGTDTFFTDARGSAVVWNTVENFHTGDYATLWGFKTGLSSFTWDATPSGAVGATGATLRANIVGGHGRTGDGIDASITFTGLSVAQAKGLVITTGGSGNSAYLMIYNQGV